MLRFLFLGLVLTFPIKAIAQDDMLVELPPVYQSGESSDGTIVDQHRIFQLRQSVQYAKDGNLYIFMSMIDQDGRTVFKMVFDPINWRIISLSEREISRTLNTTCSSAELYPIILGKVYECKSTIEVDGRELDSSTRAEFTTRVRNANGQVVGFCALVKSDIGRQIIRAQVCMSSDGKWVDFVEVLEIVPIQRI